MGDTTAKHQFWRYTLNNHTTDEMKLIHDPPGCVGIIQHVWTPEKGESGTPHIQGFIKLAKQVRKSHLIRHWLGRANYGGLDSLEYRANTLKYVQKQDATATAPTTQANTTTPLLWPGMIPELVCKWIHEHTEAHWDNWSEPAHHHRRWIRDTHGIAEQFAQWLDRQTDRHKFHKLVRTRLPDGDTEVEHEWRGKAFSPTHEAPLPLVVEYAKSQLVRQYQCETLMDKPDVVRALDKYAHEILWRIEHNQRDAVQAQNDEAEGEAGDQAPPSGTAPGTAGEPAGASDVL